jgi:LPXTG-site transpeptidase (sortase) family protein
MEKPIHDQNSDKPLVRKQRSSRTKTISKPIAVLLNLIIAGLIIVGLFLVLQPNYLHWQQDQKSADLIKSLESGDGTIILYEDELRVPGEEEEFIEQIEGWEESEPSSTVIESTTLPGSTETSKAVGPTIAGTSAGAVATTAKPTPKPIVIKAVGQIIIDKIGLAMPIADRAEAPQLRVAIGLLGGSSLPGKPGNTILLGHRMYTYGRHFNRLNEVVAGDTIVILTPGHKLTYVVSRQDIVLPSALRPTLSVTTTDKQLILVTCDPVRIASHRLLVYAKQTSDVPY